MTVNPAYLSDLAHRAQQMKADEVLVTAEGNKVNASKGIILCGCGDCDQERIYSSYLAEIVTTRIHQVRYNGGALSISPHSPLHFVIDDDGSRHAKGVVQTVDVRDSIIMKGIATVALVAHAPCGAAMGKEMTLDDIVGHLVGAKRELVKRYRGGEHDLGIRVACFLHVDWPSLAPKLRKPPRTYFVSQEVAKRWLANPPSLDDTASRRDIATIASFAPRG